jgi:hypothetical protein
MRSHILGSPRRGGRPSTAIKSDPSTRYCLVMGNISTILIVRQSFLQNAARVLTTVTGTARVQHRRSGVVGNHQADEAGTRYVAYHRDTCSPRTCRHRTVVWRGHGFLDCRGQLESSTAVHYRRYRLVRWDCGGRRPLGSKPGDALPAPPARAVPSISPRIQTMSSRSRTRFPTQ